MAYKKTAISIEEKLFQKAEKLSANLGISRSQVFAQALEFLIHRSESLEIVQKLNQVYDHEVGEPKAQEIAQAAKKRMRRIAGKW
ncbi:MAG: ChpI protein [Gemmataceae bacterium]|nr:ChpI protein [Gemmataceae bacterium]